MSLFCTNKNKNWGKEICIIFHVDVLRVKNCCETAQEATVCICQMFWGFCSSWGQTVCKASVLLSVFTAFWSDIYWQFTAELNDQDWTGLRWTLCGDYNSKSFLADHFYPKTSGSLNSFCMVKRTETYTALIRFVLCVQYLFFFTNHLGWHIQTVYRQDSIPTTKMYHNCSITRSNHEGGVLQRQKIEHKQSGW